MIDIQEEILIGMDVRGQDIFLKDFRRDAGVLKRCKKLTPQGRELKRISKFYRSNERKIPDDYKKIRGIE
jgi:hypothetical protein